MKHFPLHFGGVDRESTDTRDQVDPATERVWATCAEASNGDVDAAVGSAATAYRQWATLAPGRRAEHLLAFASALEARADHVSRIESRSNGKPIRETRLQVAFAARMLRYFAGLADKVFGHVVPLDASDVLDYYTREPHGVCALIVAWNSPVQLTVNKIAPALAAGNTVVVKPSELASASVIELARIGSRAGMPPGSFNVVTGGATVGEALCHHPDVALISLTGGIRTGRRVAQIAGERLVPVVLELGGKSPQIVFADADRSRAISGIVAGIFAAAGQSCMAGSRLYVQEPIFDEVMRELAHSASQIRIGDPLLPETEMGPLITSEHRERTLDVIGEAVSTGAHVLTGGRATGVGASKRGYFLEPTILVDVTPSMRCVREELFAPVLVAQPFTALEEVAALADDGTHGLAAGIWTQDVSTAMRLAAQIRAGTVWVNDYRRVSAGAPFGGFRSSGHGRERGLESLRTYTTTKNVVINYGAQARDPFTIGTS